MIGIKSANIVGHKFERLEVVKREKQPGEKNSHWLCKCDCGNEIIASLPNLRSGNTKSCGCLNSELSTLRRTTHNLSKSRIYKIYHGMKQRCYDNNSYNYRNYGAKGIKVCSEWINDFTAFYDWSIRNGYNDHLTIDRICNDGNYEPHNCRWADVETQQNNKRNNTKFTIGGKTKTVSQWAKEYGIKADLVYARIHKSKWDIEKALTEPICKSQQRFKKSSAADL